MASRASARITLDHACGTSGIIESGYGFPTAGAEKREFVFSLGTRRAYLRSTPAGIRLYPRDRRPCLDLSVDLDQDPLYGRFVDMTLESFRKGTAPIAGLEDAYHAVRVTEAAYQSSELRTAVQLKVG